MTFFFFSLTLIGPLLRNNPETTQGAQSGKEAKANLVQTFFKVTYKTGQDYRVPPFDFFVFFRHCATFFEKFFVSKGSPLSFCTFLTYSTKPSEAKGSPLLIFFCTVRHFPLKKFFLKFQVFFEKNVLRFLSLRFSADFRRSRLVLSTKEDCRVSVSLP